MPTTRVDRNAEQFQALLATKFHRTGEASARPGAETILVLHAKDLDSIVPRSLETGGRIVHRAHSVDQAFHIMGQIVFDVVIVEDHDGSLSLPFAVGARARGQRIPMILLARKTDEDEWDRYSGLFGRRNVFELPLTDHAVRAAVADRIRSYRELMAAAQRIGDEDHGVAAPDKNVRDPRTAVRTGSSREVRPGEEVTGRNRVARGKKDTDVKIGAAFSRY